MEFQNKLLLVCLESLLERGNIVGSFTDQEKLITRQDEKAQWEKKIAMGNEAIKRGSLEKAISHYQDAKEIVEKRGNNEEILGVLLEILGNINEALSKIMEAYQHYEKALALWENLNRPLWAALLHYKIAQMYEQGLLYPVSTNLMEMAILRYKKAIDYFQAAGCTEEKRAELEIRIKILEQTLEKRKQVHEEERDGRIRSEVTFAPKSLSQGSFLCQVHIEGQLDTRKVALVVSKIKELLENQIFHLLIVFTNFRVGSASSCMGILVKEADKLAEKGGKTVFVGLPEKVGELWEMLGLKDFLPLCQTEEEALQILEKASR